MKNANEQAALVILNAMLRDPNAFGVLVHRGSIERTIALIEVSIVVKAMTEIQIGDMHPAMGTEIAAIYRAMLAASEE